MKTNEGSNQYRHSLNHHLEFFSKAASVYMPKGKKRQSFYENEADPLDLFVNAWIVDPKLSMALVFWLRDCRNGSGNRSTSKAIYRWIAKNDSDWMKENISLIPQVGRWDDLRSLFHTPLEIEAAEHWAEAIRQNDVLAAKWADRKDRQIRRRLSMKISDFRRLLASIRSPHIVESKMCNGKWDKIRYKTVPSVAMARYTNAFKRHDEDRFNEFKEGLKRGTETVHADTLFPHDCVRTAKNGDIEIADAQFEALPNYMEDTNERIMVLCDTSGSMQQPVGGNIEAIDVSQSLALYCSAKMPENSPFYKRFIGFCSESSFKDWRGMSFSDAIRNRGSKRIFDGAIGTTRIDLALNFILNHAIKRSISQELMPTTLMIISDMQFSTGSRISDTEVEHCLSKWAEAGYEIPKVIYWNLSIYSGQPATKATKNVGLISGFSPSILKAVLSGEDFSPMGIMMRTLAPYLENIKVPEENA